MGYSPENGCYRVYDLESKTTILFRDVKFSETTFLEVISDEDAEDRGDSSSKEEDLPRSDDNFGKIAVYLKKQKKHTEENTEDTKADNTTGVEEFIQDSTVEDSYVPSKLEKSIEETDDKSKEKAAAIATRPELGYRLS